MAPVAELIIEGRTRPVRVELGDELCPIRTPHPELIRAIDLAFCGLEKTPHAAGRAGTYTARFVCEESLAVDSSLFLVRAVPPREGLEAAKQQLAADLRQVEAGIQQMSDVAALSPDLPDKMHRFRDSKEKLEGDLRKFAQERDDAEHALHLFELPSLGTDQYFIGALAAVGLSLGAAVFLEVPWLAFLNLFGAFVACGIAIGHVNKLEEKHLLRTRVKTLDERDQRLKASFESEMGELERIKASEGPMHAEAAIARRAELNQLEARRLAILAEQEDVTRDLQAHAADATDGLIRRAAQLFGTDVQALEAARRWPAHIAKLVLVASCPKSIGAPLLIHDFFGALDEPDRTTAIELVHRIAQTRQVIVLTARERFQNIKAVDVSALA